MPLGAYLFGKNERIVEQLLQRRRYGHVVERVRGAQRLVDRVVDHRRAQRVEAHEVGDFPFFLQFKSSLWLLKHTHSDVSSQIMQSLRTLLVCVVLILKV